MEIINCHWKFCSRVPFLAAPASSPWTRIFDPPKVEPCSAHRPLHVCALSRISTSRKNFSGESTPKSHIWVEIRIFVFWVWGGPKVQIQTLILGCRCFLTNLQISDTNTKIIDSLKSGSGFGLVVTKLGAYLLLLAFGVNRNSFRCRVDCVLTCWCGVTLLVCDIGPWCVIVCGWDSQSWYCHWSPKSHHTAQGAGSDGMVQSVIVPFTCVVPACSHHQRLQLCVIHDDTFESAVVYDT